MYVREIDRTAAIHAAPGAATRLWQGFPVALRAPLQALPTQAGKPGVRSVTDVLIHGVTHVMIQNSTLCPSLPECAD